MNINKLIACANEENVLATFYDKVTGVEVGNFTFGKRYHWWILYVIVAISIAVNM